MITAADDHFVIVSSLRDRRSTAVCLKNELQMIRRVNVSERTIRKRLAEAGLHSRRPTICTQLLPRYRQHRLRFARLHSDWTLEQWGNVLFTDESRVCLSSPRMVVSGYTDVEMKDMLTAPYQNESHIMAVQS